MQPVALVGLGGMGKTQVALHLAHRVKENKPEYSVLWMPAFSIASFEQACTELSQKLSIQSTDKTDVKEAVRQYLDSENAGRWFLIIDDVDDMEALEGQEGEAGGILDFLPQSENGQILIITRSQKVAANVAGSATVRLPEITNEEATKLLEKSLTKDQMKNQGAVDNLLIKLSNLPLAIAQAAAYMSMTDIHILEYLRVFDKINRDMIELLSEKIRDKTHHRESQGAVTTTWIISFEQIRNTAPPAVSLLSFIACIEPSAIPLSILPKPETKQQMVNATN